MSNNKRGRKKGSPNLITTQASKKMAEWIINKFTEIKKCFAGVPIDRRFSELRKQVEDLMKYADPETRAGISEGIYLVLQPELFKMDSYFSHVDSKNKFPELRKIYKLLKPEHIRNVSEALNENAIRKIQNDAKGQDK